MEQELALLEIKNKPAQIWNLDETAFNFDPSRGKAVGEKGKLLHRNTQGSSRENTTVLACASAAGELLPPLIVFQANTIEPIASHDDLKVFEGKLKCKNYFNEVVAVGYINI